MSAINIQIIITCEGKILKTWFKKIGTYYNVDFFFLFITSLNWDYDFYNYIEVIPI